MNIEAKPHDRRATEIGRKAEVATIEVDDPYEAGAKIVVLRQLRGDPLARLHAHHQIDDAQYEAGKRYRQDWEIAERGARAIDPTREAVDGGQLAEPITESQQRARMRLARVHMTLGRHMKSLVQAVLIGGSTVEALAEMGFQRPGERWANYYGKMFRDALELLAVEYALADPSRNLPVRQIIR